MAVTILAECWEWGGSLSFHGYARKLIDGRERRLHRVAFEWANGPIPEGKIVCHRCDNRRCVNPAHLFVGDAQANVQDMVAKGRHRNQVKTNCLRGHPLSGANLILEKCQRADGVTTVSRRCRTCKNNRQREAARQRYHSFKGVA